jgi:hypothetical protein
MNFNPATNNTDAYDSDIYIYCHECGLSIDTGITTCPEYKSNISQLCKMGRFIAKHKALCDIINLEIKEGYEIEEIRIDEELDLSQLNDYQEIMNVRKAYYEDYRKNYFKFKNLKSSIITMIDDFKSKISRI